MLENISLVKYQCNWIWFILYNKFTLQCFASSKPCFRPKYDSLCQVWAHMLRSTFLKLVLWRVQMWIIKTISNILNHEENTNLLFYIFYKIKIVEGLSFFIENVRFSDQYLRFCIFVHICCVPVTNTKFLRS